MTEVILPEGITTINDYTFYGCSGLPEITIPNSVTTIGESAFSGCSELTEVILPEGITTINDYTFYGCSGLTEITIPNSVTSIGYGAFADCNGLTEVTISANVASIGELAFGGCTRIKNVYAYPLVPPVLETSSFDVYVNDNATLHVVENCKSAYEKASAWRYFLLIVEDLEVGSGVQDAWAQNSSVRAYGDNGDIVVTGCNEGDCIAIYNSCGSMLHTKNAADNTVRISINVGGIYLVKVGDAVMRVLL